MSGHDNSVSGQGTSPFGGESFHFDPSLDLETDWQEDPFWREVLANMSSNDLYSAANGPMQTAAGGMNSDQANNQADQVTFTSSSAQIPGAEPIPDMPLANANQANDQSFPAQTSQLLSSSSPINYGIHPYYVPGLNNDPPVPTWSPTRVDQPILPQPYPFTYSQGEYPTSLQQDCPVLERTVFQKGGQSLAGAGTINPGSNSQVFTAGNHFFGSQLQGGSLNASNAVGHGLPLQHAPSEGAANSAMSYSTAPVRLETLAPKAASDVGAIAPTNQGSTDNAKPMLPSVAPKEDETKAKQTTVRNRPTTSKAKQTAVKVPLYNSELLVESLAAAREVIAINKIELKVVDDDCDIVATQVEDFVPRMAKALDADFKTQAEGHEKLTAEGRAEFTRWQKEHDNKAWAVLNNKKIKDKPKFAQACAMVLYDKILDAHQTGYIADPAKAISNGTVDIETKCSERMNAAITAIEEYTIVRYDFLRQERLDAFCASPRGFVGRKIENCFVNYKKKPGTGPVKLEVDGKNSVAAAGTKSDGKRKRNEPSTPASDDEGEDESDGEFVQPVKRTKRT